MDANWPFPPAPPCRCTPEYFGVCQINHPGGEKQSPSCCSFTGSCRTEGRGATIKEACRAATANCLIAAEPGAGHSNLTAILHQDSATLRLGAAALRARVPSSRATPPSMVSPLNTALAPPST